MYYGGCGNGELRFSGNSDINIDIEILGKQNSLLPSGPVIKCLLWDKITDSNLKTVLDDLLPPKRTIYVRGVTRNYIIPLVRTERFKRTFMNRCLFL